MTAPDTPQAAARFLNAYARAHHAGAFATPTAKELAEYWRPKGGKAWRWWPSPDGGGVGAVTQRLTRDSLRRDFTGRRIRMPAGSNVVTHLARTPGAAPPDLSAYDYVSTYVEDRELSDALRSQGREVAGVRISAASEVIGCWGLPGTGHRYDPADVATVTRLPVTVPDDQRAQVLAELRHVDTWHDDYPYYNKQGAWGAVSLRGYNPADPTFGLKPSEMSKAWWKEHPEATAYDRCDWTTLAADCPALVALTQAVAAGYGGRTERVRLLRMQGHPNNPGRLLRHTDITDRAAGTADGQIIRLHLPLVTHPDVTMTAWDLTGRQSAVHLPAWTLWYLDARKPHAVTNPTAVDRVHLVVDVTAGPDTRAALAAGDEHATQLGAAA